MLELGAQQGPEGGEGQIAGKILIPRLKLCLVYKQYLTYFKLCLVYKQYLKLCLVYKQYLKYFKLCLV